jgi:hypothetical protein
MGSMSNTGVFGWIRDGVKQSVLLGVSDAMEVMGTPLEPSQLHPALHTMGAGSAQRIATGTTEPVNPRAAGDASPQRKRLGRSLKDITPAAANPPKPAS